MIHRIIVSLFILLFLASCFQKDPDARLAHISALTETSPDEAFDSLRVISYDSLSDADKHLYDFLSVKVSDKSMSKANRTIKNSGVDTGVDMNF
jgi:hypothetical protein